MEKIHNHDHHHGHHHEVTNMNSAFIIGIILNTAFVVIELVIGFSSKSLALISDAGHNATDVFSLLLSLFAFKMMKVKASENYTYGYKKLSILTSLLNAILLVVTTGIIFYEGFRRINSPVEIQGKIISMVAFIGVAINAISAWLFFKDKEKDINIKGAYLHLLSDALVAFGVVVAGIIIYYTHWFWLDTAISFIIGIIILVATWNLLNDRIRLSLDGVPRGVNFEKVKQTILACKAVIKVDHIHIWPISSSENAMTAHIEIAPENIIAFDKVKNDIKHQLEHINIHHTTLEIEFQNSISDCMATQ
jgi:cobalt-zinc-cadmium efflux system protein